MKNKIKNSFNMTNAVFTHVMHQYPSYRPTVHQNGIVLTIVWFVWLPNLVSTKSVTQCNWKNSWSKLHALALYRQ